MAAAERGDPRQLRRAGIFKKDTLDRYPALRIEESLDCHPFESRLAQVDAGWIVMTVACLVADDRYSEFSIPAASKKIRHASERHGPADASTVDIALQALPSQLAVRQLPNCIAHRAFRILDTSLDQAALARRPDEDAVVVDQCVVEIDTYLHRCRRARLALSCPILLPGGSARVTRDKGKCDRWPAGISKRGCAASRKGAIQQIRRASRVSPSKLYC